jgi:uncharacterized protein (DUF1501 family)
LIVIFLRGAVDGLSVVVPFAEQAYYDARPTIAIGRPGTNEGALPLNADFGLHPALASLLPLWRDRNLAFIHASGSPDPTRSHFDAQLYIENGTPGRSDTVNGWMNRVLAMLPAPHGPIDAISIGPTLPQILKGRLTVANLSLGPQPESPTWIDWPQVSGVFDRLYARNDPIGRVYREGRAAHAELAADLAREAQRAGNGAPPPMAFPAIAGRLAHLISQEHCIRLAFASLGGWDTHVAQGKQKGQLANHLSLLGDGLAALADGLGGSWPNTVVIVLSEFGRTVHENASGGTDHGHGGVIWVLGGAIRGGDIYGDWLGLATAQLYQGRDLAVTTDYRSALAAILERHLRLTDRQLTEIFPGLPLARPDLRRLLAT